MTPLPPFDPYAPSRRRRARLARRNRIRTLARFIVLCALVAALTLAVVLITALF